MSAPDAAARELMTLLPAVRDGTVTVAQQHRIAQLLEQHPGLQQDYVDYLLLCVELNSFQPLSQAEQAELMPITKQDGSAHDPIDIEAIEKRAQRELNTFLAEQERLRRMQEERIRAKDFRLVPLLQGLARRTESAVHFITHSAVRVAALAALLLLLMGVVQYVRSHRVVAMLGDQAQAQWTDPPAGKALRPGLLFLEAGFSRITFNKGAEVIIQAPCEFELRSPNRMYLWSGAISAKVPPRAIGFRIDTPDGAVTDFGTAFGVAMDTRSGFEARRRAK